MQDKISSIVQAAVATRCNRLVLSAFGCGAFGHAPEVVAEMFKTEFKRTEIQYASFCIIDDHNAFRSHNHVGNYSPFKTIFEEEKKEERKAD